MAYGLTADGFVKKPLSVIRAELEAAYRAAWGNGIDLTPDTDMGKEIGIDAEREAALWELAEAVYNSQYIDGASDSALTTLVRNIGLTRKAATRSTVTATLTGTNGKPVPAGTLFAQDTTGEQFRTTETVVISGATAVRCESVNTGPIAAAAGTLTTIVNSVNGLASVTNALDAALGTNEETDPELYARYLESLSVSGGGSVPAIRARLRALAGVVATIVIENTLDVADGDGRPGHSIECVVQGGNDTEIANAIFNPGGKGAGIETYSTAVGPANVSVVVTDDEGDSHTINFSRPTAVNIYVDITLTYSAAYPLDGDDEVKAAIIAYGLSLNIGDDVIPHPYLESQIAAVPGIVDITIDIGTAPGPSGDANIVIPRASLAVFDTSRITVVSTPA